MQIENSVALVTGAGRGLGREYVRQLQERGARTVYAAVRSPASEPIPGAEPLVIDVTDPEAIARAAVAAPDVSLLINNAGISTLTPLIGGDLANIRRELDTHFWGTLLMARAFAPALARRGGGAILNMLSALSLRSYDGAGAYAAAKAAQWSLTDSVRLDLAAQGTQVTGLFVGAVDTDMMAGYHGPKVTPRDVVAAGLDAIRDGVLEVFVDDTAQEAKATLAERAEVRYPALAAQA